MTVDVFWSSLVYETGYGINVDTRAGSQHSRFSLTKRHGAANFALKSAKLKTQDTHLETATNEREIRRALPGF